MRTPGNPQFLTGYQTMGKGPVPTFQPRLGILPAPQRALSSELLDVAGTKALTAQRRAQARDYLDIDALIRHGIDLLRKLAAATVVYGRSFN
jgi:hypothetical protein